MKNFITRTISAILFVAIMVAGFLRPEGMIFLFALITGMSIWEFTGLVNNIKSVTVNRFISTAAGVYLFFAVAGFCSGMTPSAVFIPYLLTIIYLFVSELYTANENAIHDWAYTMLSQMYIALPFSTINVLAFNANMSGEISFNALLPLSVFIFLWINDAGAYCVGSLLGKHKLFPRISPAKSWEGSIGGGVLVLLVATIIWSIAHMEQPLFDAKNLLTDENIWGLPAWLGLGLVVVVFGTWGDLVESLFKRTLGIKDSGSVMPGHGGMLDRFDSSLMAIPAAVVYIYTLTLI